VTTADHQKNFRLLDQLCIANLTHKQPPSESKDGHSDRPQSQRRYHELTERKLELSAIVQQGFERTNDLLAQALVQACELVQFI